MKQQYEAPELEIRWFESENVIAFSETPNIPETDSKDAFNW